MKRIVGIAQREYELFELENSPLGDVVERFFNGKWAVAERKPAKCPVCNSRPWRWATIEEAQELDAIYQQWKDDQRDMAQVPLEHKPAKRTGWDDAIERAMAPIKVYEVEQ